MLIVELSVPRKRMYANERGDVWNGRRFDPGNKVVNVVADVNGTKTPLPWKALVSNLLNMVVQRGYSLSFRSLDITAMTTVCHGRCRKVWRFETKRVRHYAAFAHNNGCLPVKGGHVDSHGKPVPAGLVDAMFRFTVGQWQDRWNDPFSDAPPCWNHLLYHEAKRALLETREMAEDVVDEHKTIHNVVCLWLFTKEADGWKPQPLKLDRWRQMPDDFVADVRVIKGSRGNLILSFENYSRLLKAFTCTAKLGSKPKVKELSKGLLALVSP